MTAQHIGFMIGVLLFVSCVYAYAADDHAAEDNAATAQERPVIVLAAFGTSVPKAQAALENIDSEMRKAFPAHEIRWAFTSQFIINKLKNKGQTTIFASKVPIRNLAQIYADLKAGGYRDVVVQSLHVVPGGEYTEVLKEPTQGLRVRYGVPLLATPAKIEAFAKALAPRFGDAETITILCGHGNDKHVEYNKELVALAAYVQEHYKHVFVATVEGKPGTDKPFADAKATGLRKVRFIPIMVVAGDHIMNDVMGDEEESWKNRLGLPASSDTGMGLNHDIVNLYITNLREALAAD